MLLPWLLHDSVMVRATIFGRYWYAVAELLAVYVDGFFADAAYVLVAY